MTEDMRKNAIEAILGSLQTVYKPAEMPCLMMQYKKWQSEKPLKGLKVFDATPLFHNTLAKYLPLLAGGAELTIGIHDRFNHDPKIAEFLKKLHIPILFNDFTGSDEDIVLDCAAIHAQKTPRYGFIELTRSGEALFAGADKACISVDRSVIKYFEDSLGTADGLMRALKHLNISAKGEKILLFGYGKVGSGIANLLLDEFAGLTIVEDLQKIDILYPFESIDFREKELVEKEAARSALIITATGVPGIICQNYDADKFVNSPAILINMGAEDEFGECIAADRALNQKFPLNFILPEPTRLCYLDATFALHNESALMLLKSQPLAPGLHKPMLEMEDRLIRITLKKSIIHKEVAKFLNHHFQKK
jgi:adenosylhomocysteinase